MTYTFKELEITSKNCTVTNIRVFSQKIKINEKQSLRGQKEGFRMKISE